MKLNSYLETQVGDVIKFPDVQYNAGSGYSASTGIFTTPSNGTYEFTLITANEVNNVWMRTDLMRGRSQTTGEYFVYLGCAIIFVERLFIRV